ncbi:NAD(P)-dependent oxidoreductase [Aspergillus glaucus CBS 516.65]|uniref:6-phosphogluconate dehydrogenase NADP-binding domain-containing protein n=1 Tax=Aspergillus glaucus CBS 516.65 TaxID=1160497 RepID=A0A1L9VU77_ASPGL|nr:hypothetical protein ASPGLDRAFT_166228 [Aspergillus glaucus CBS 516.65]OJJ87454.1 hypothetical protein ASPGLDRAFT_166228 [Aspergillus glaucus CBS 516.65]
MAGKPRAFGFVGLGNMGSMMAANLAAYAERNALPRVRIWNRTRSKIEYIAQQNHCKISNSLSDLAQSCDIVHTCLANDQVAISVYTELFTSSSASIFVDHSTLFPTTIKALQEQASHFGLKYLSCPVFGPPAAAKSASLLIALSGDITAQQTVKEYIVPTLGKATIDCGEDPAKGALLKILGNNCILGTIELLSESFTLAEKTGFDVNLFYEFIQAWFPAPAWVNYGKKIRDGAFSGATGFTIPGGMKDASFIRTLGAETSTPTPLIDQAWNHLCTAKAVGGEDLDWSACAAGMRVTAGLPPFKGEDFTLDKFK